MIRKRRQELIGTCFDRQPARRSSGVVDQDFGDVALPCPVSNHGLELVWLRKISDQNAVALRSGICQLSGG